MKKRKEDLGLNKHTKKKKSDMYLSRNSSNGGRQITQVMIFFPIETRKKGLSVHGK